MNTDSFVDGYGERKAVEEYINTIAIQDDCDYRVSALFNSEFRDYKKESQETPNISDIGIKALAIFLELLLHKRKKAKTRKDYEAADRIRDQIKGIGFDIQDINN